MIYTRWGSELTVLRLATKADVLAMDPPLNAEALINLQCKSWVVVDMGKGPTVVRLGELRADEGWQEIAAKLGDTWECPDCEQRWPNDEVCHNAKCRKTQAARLKRWRERQPA